MALNWFAISEGEKEREHYQLIITKLSSYTFSVKRKLPSFPSIRLLRHRRTSGDAKLTSSNNTHQPFRTASTRAPYTHTHKISYYMVAMVTSTNAKAKLACG